MTVLWAVLAGAGSLALSALVAELRDVAGWAAPKIIRRASLLLPRKMVAMRSEEWLAELTELEGLRLAKLVFAVKVTGAAMRLRWTYRKEIRHTRRDRRETKTYGQFIAPRHKVLAVRGAPAECGRACVQMVLAFHDVFVSRSQLDRLELRSARDLVRLARAQGFEAKGWQTDVPDLRSLPLPSIAFVGFSHFIVVEGGTRRGIRIMDPASGRRRLTWREFDGWFTGVVLTFTPKVLPPTSGTHEVAA